MTLDITVTMPRLYPKTILEGLGMTHVAQDSDEEWLGCCPFPAHADRTPSFYVNVQKGVYYCFGCQRGGPLVMLVQSRLKLDHLEAGILVARMRPRKDGTEERPTRTFTIFPELYLQQFQAIQSSEYLEGRGISAATLHAFGVRWDTQRNRIVLPVRDPLQRLVGFVMRETGQAEKPYIYSNELPKSLVLFNLHRVIAEQASAVMVVEGTMDVLRAYEAGFHYAVATLGSSLSQEQAKLLQRHVKRAWLAFDNDIRGQLFTFLSEMRLQDLHVSSRRVVIPEHRKDIGECTHRELQHILREVHRG